MPMPVAAGEPQPVNVVDCTTVAPFAWVVAAPEPVPLTPRVQPVNVVAVLPEYVIVSESIKMLPDDVNAAVELTVTVVFDEESVPPVITVVAVPRTIPPQVPAPHPTFWV